MFELFTADDIREMFDEPKTRGNQKYDWDNMDRGMSFAINCEDVSENYTPKVPDRLVNLGFKIKTSKRPLKNDGTEYIVVTRVE